jgi:hypothetical protein
MVWELAAKQLCKVMWIFTIQSVILIGSVYGQDDTATLVQDTVKKQEIPKYEFSGYAALEVGQMQYAHYAFVSSGIIDHNWIGSTYLNLGLKSHITDFFSVYGAIEARLGYDTKPLDQALDPTSFPSSQNIYVTIPNAEGIFSFGNREYLGLTIGIGRFEYKYNPESRNLGEYLFRTGTYPAYIRTSFDLPLARINGIVGSFTIGDFLRQDILLTTLTDIQPFTDFSLTYIADASFFEKALDVGAGVQFANLISTMPDQTSQVNYSGNGYLKAPGDTGYYTFKGTKLMGRVTVDPKQFSSSDNFKDFFGKEGGKLYAEASVLGLESYPASNKIDSFNLSNTVGYDSLWQKIPITLGVNVPTHPFTSYGLMPIAIAMSNFDVFKKNWAVLGGAGILGGIVTGGGTWLLEKYVGKNLRLDVLSVEAEWYGCKYPDSYFNVTLSDYAVPDRPKSGSGLTWDDYTRDNWKWSIFAEKTFFNKFSLIFQIARDHLRLHTLIMKFEDYQEALITNDQWYWMGKVKFNF